MILKGFYFLKQYIDIEILGDDIDCYFFESSGCITHLA